MSISIIRMTGLELKEIWTNSKLPDTEIKALFGFSRATLYNRFDDEMVPLSVESVVDKNPTLSQWKNKLQARNNPQDNNQIAVLKNMGEMMQMLAGTITQSITQSITQVGTMMADQMERREKDYEMIRRTNDQIIKNNDTLLSIVRRGVEQNAIVFQSPNKQM